MLVGGVRGGLLGRTVAARRVAGVCGCCVAGVRTVLVLVGALGGGECGCRAGAGHADRVGVHIVISIRTW
jgi:hypothetical protein